MPKVDYRRFMSALICSQSRNVWNMKYISETVENKLSQQLSRQGH